MSDKIDVKIGSPVEALWTKVRDEAKTLIKGSEDNLIIQKEFLAVAERKIKEEIDSFK